MVIYIAFSLIASTVLLDRFILPAGTPRLDALLKFMSKRSRYLMILLTVCCAVISFAGAGDLCTPKTHVEIREKRSFTFDFGKEIPLQTVNLLIGRNDDALLMFETSADGLEWEKYGGAAMPLHPRNQFMWVFFEVQVQTRYLRLTASAEILALYESGFFLQGSGEHFTEVICNEDTRLTDEQHLVKSRRSFKSDSFFDEYAYLANGYDVIHGRDIFERAHPPLSSTIIALGLEIFGMSPFAFRFFGIIFGVAMVPLLYALALSLSGSRNTALFAAFLYSADFMRFVQSRTATIEVILAFFVLLTFYFLHALYRDSLEEGPARLRYLPLAGLAAGLACSCKLSGAFALIPTAALCAIIGVRECRKRGGTRAFTLKFALSAFLSIVLLPAVVYFMTFIPVMASGGGISAFIEYNVNMIGVHSDYNIVLPYVSDWPEWLLVKTPFVFNTNTITMNGEMLRSSIVSMGNPLLWWMFIPALAGLVPQSLIGGKRGKAGALFLLLSIFLMFAPYLFMGRIKFMYYFLSFVPLAALAFCLGLKKLVEMGWITARCALVYAVLTIITFAMYYPVLSGTFIDPDYAGKWLNALKSWRLV